jgi:hypothetical protein
MQGVRDLLASGLVCRYILIGLRSRAMVMGPWRRVVRKRGEGSRMFIAVK